MAQLGWRGKTKAKNLSGWAVEGGGSDRSVLHGEPVEAVPNHNALLAVGLQVKSQLTRAIETHPLNQIHPAPRGTSLDQSTHVCGTPINARPIPLFSPFLSSLINFGSTLRLSLHRDNLLREEAEPV